MHLAHKIVGAKAYYYAALRTKCGGSMKFTQRYAGPPTAVLAPIALILANATCFPASLSAASPVALTPAKMPRLGTIDERFQSYNIEMVEVTGGRFWAPYK